jgi:CubicO group peptidase (beta-lactamase class C family)
MAAGCGDEGRVAEDESMSSPERVEWLRHGVGIFQHVNEIPAVAAGVRRGETVETAAVGWADVARARGADEATQFRIGSITKTFTAAVVVGLAAQNQLDLDEPAEAYLPSVDLGRPRLRQLLTHCSGLQR